MKKEIKGPALNDLESTAQIWMVVKAMKKLP
jgi:hypothetical protein